MKQNRRKHSPSFKARVAIRQAQAEAREALKGEETMPNWPAAFRFTPARFANGRIPWLRVLPAPVALNNTPVPVAKYQPLRPVLPAS